MAIVKRKDTGEVLFDGSLKDAKKFLGNGTMEVDRIYEEDVETGEFITDEEGNPVVAEEGKEVELELQYDLGNKAEAIQFLADTDWYVVRETETGIKMPSEVKATRSAIRVRL